MPTLLIHEYDEYDGWCVVVSNSNVRYSFVGADYDEQYESIKMFADGMKAKDFEAIKGTVDGVEITPAELGDELFQTTDVIVFGTRPIYSAIDDDVLMDVLEEAGEALLRFGPP